MKKHCLVSFKFSQGEERSTSLQKKLLNHSFIVVSFVNLRMYPFSFSFYIHKTLAMCINSTLQSGLKQATLNTSLLHTNHFGLDLFRLSK